MPANSPSLLSSPSVWIQTIPVVSNCIPSGELNRFPRVDVRRPRIEPVGMHGRIARHHVEIPREGIGGVVRALRPPAHDLAVTVRLTRVDRVDRHRIAARVGADRAVICRRSTARVVRQAAIALRRHRVHRDPFGPVHRRRAHRRRGHAREDGDLRRVHAGGIRRQRDPPTRHVVVEPRHRKLSLGQQGRGIPAGHVDVARHPAVHELAALVIAQIDDDATVRRDRRGRVLVLEAAERRALDRRGRRIGRVDLDDVAEASAARGGSSTRRSGRRRNGSYSGPAPAPCRRRSVRTRPRRPWSSSDASVAPK